MLGWQWLAALLLVSLPGCASLKPQSRLLDQVPGSTMTVSELRIRTRALSAPLSGELEALSDTIARDSDDPGVRRDMTRFKSESIAQLQSALFRPDPVAAIVDAWALIVQLQNMLATLPDRSRYGQKSLALAAQCFADMEAKILALWRELTGKRDPELRQQVHAWAARNPITQNMAARPSTVALLAHLTARSGVGLASSLGQLTEQTEDVVARVDLQTAYVPKQVRWQTEYLLRDLLSDPTLSAGPAPAQLFGSLERLTLVAEELPDVMARERAALYDLLHRERLGAQGFVSSESTAAIEALRHERELLLSALDEQRRRTAADASRIGADFIDRGFQRSTELADRVLERVLLGSIALGLILLCGVLVWRRRDTSPRVGWKETRA
jgi:hypothetical protein